MQVRLLGPVDVVLEGMPQPVPGARRRTLLALLAINCGRVVESDRLRDLAWAATTPPAANTLQTHLSYLRRTFRFALVARSPGYLLDLGDDGTDVLVAERLIRQGLLVADHADRAQRLQAALALWRGRPLADVVELAWAAEQRRRLDQLWLHAKRGLVDAQLALGEHVQVIPDLQQLVLEHPYDEPIHGQLMLALYRAGRQVEALGVYADLRRALADGLGIDPGQAIREQHSDVLNQSPGLDLRAPLVILPPTAPTGTPIAQLPPALPLFVGRRTELASLDAVLSPSAPHGSAHDPTPTSAILLSVSGTAGVGKTALAVRWANQVADRFPDGQLYVDLRGYDPSGSALDPAEALRGFLDAFGVPVQRIPTGAAAQAALFRSVVAGKRVLAVLDNARDAEQVRPLLPGAPGCLVIVTSRNELTGLIATDGARPLTLELLSTAEARDLLIRRLGKTRVTAEQEVVTDIIARCARLPLALAIAAARAAIRPGFPLAALAAELREAAGGLDVLHGGEPATDLRAVFSWSQQTLSAGAGRLFRLLGLHPGPDLTALAAASLAGTSPQQTRILLAELTRAHLVAEHAPGRYTFHDLLRAFATDQAQAQDDTEVRRTATHRMLDHYLHSAHAAALLLRPTRVAIVLDSAQSGVVSEAFDDYDSALAWFTAEREVLLAAVGLAAGAGFDRHASQLAWALSIFLIRYGHWTEQVRAQRTALDATRRLGDRAGQANALQGLAHGYARSGRLDDAEIHYREALHLRVELDDPAGQAQAHMGLAHMAEKQDRTTDSLLHYQRAVDLFRVGGNRAGEANALNGVGWCHALLGDYQQALESCTHALDLLLELGARDGQTAVWDSLGSIHRGLADYEQAVVCHERSIALCRDIGDRYWEADAVNNLGDTYHAMGDADAADKAWHQALDILDRLDDRKAEQIQGKLTNRRATSTARP